MTDHTQRDVDVPPHMSCWCDNCGLHAQGVDKEGCPVCRPDLYPCNTGDPYAVPTRPPSQPFGGSATWRPTIEETA